MTIIITFSIMMMQLQPFVSQNLLLHHHPRFGFYRCCEWNKRVGLGPNSQFFPTRAAKRDSEFEIDREKAREALRKLDQQLDVMSQKQTNNVPKTKAANPYNVTDEAIKDVQDTGSFLPLAFFALLVFTIVYNIVFIKVIKPSVDGPQVELAPVRSSIMKEILKAELSPSIQLTPSPEPTTFLDPLNITSMACPLAITEAERGIPDLLKRVRAVFDKLFTDKETYEAVDEVASLENKTAHQLAMEVIRNFAASQQNDKSQ